jgi:Catalase/Catalase-related immune-responsive
MGVGSHGQDAHAIGERFSDCTGRRTPELGPLGQARVIVTANFQPLGGREFDSPIARGRAGQQNREDLPGGSLGYNPFDLTKVWPHKDFPLIEVGVLELNRNPANYFAEVEQASFSPANVVPGVSHSPDKMLQFRIFSYADAHRYRLGVNYESLPVNRPRCPVHNYHRDGAMRFDGNEGGAVNYEPNSFGGPQQDHAFREPPLPITGDADRHDHRAGNDDYSQAGNLFRLMSAAQKKLLIAALVGAMRGVPVEIQKRQIAHFAKADPAYGADVAEGLGVKVTEAAAGAGDWPQLCCCRLKEIQHGGRGEIPEITDQKGPLSLYPHFSVRLLGQLRVLRVEILAVTPIRLSSLKSDGDRQPRRTPDRGLENSWMVGLRRP